MEYHGDETYATLVFHNGFTCVHLCHLCPCPPVPTVGSRSTPQPRWIPSHHYSQVESRCPPLWAQASNHGGAAISALWAVSAATVPSSPT